MFLLTTNIYSQVPYSDIQGFSGKYNNGTGNASALSFEFENIKFLNNPDFELYKQANTFFLSTPEQSIELNMLPEKIHELENLVIHNLNLKSNESSLEVNVENINGTTLEKTLMTKYLNLKCDISNKDFMLGVLNTCLNNSSTFSLSNITIDNKSYKDINVSINNHKLSFQAKVSGIGAKGNGEITYLKNESKIIIKIDKVKAGFFNVTKKFFDEIKESESETVLINRPYIEILLK